MDSTQLRSHVQEGLGAAYTIVRELGGGGMSRVFLANDTALGRRVVVKVLEPDLAEGLSAERFAREVRLAARLQHPNILPVFAAGEAGGTHYYTMPFVDGESLRARLDRDSNVPLSDAINILRDIARALAYAHDQGVVHRDIKPDNVLLSPDAAVVADFGIAKAVDAARGPTANSASLTQHGMAIGTPAYMAPEQASADPSVDFSADLYSWGVVAYEVLAARHPFAAKQTAQAFIVAHLVEVPTALDVHRTDLAPGLVDVVMRCLSKSTKERPANAREILDVLSSQAQAGATLAGTVRRSLPSIAVLPFANLSADPENAYFSEGISEEVLSVLAQNADLRVAARSSSFAFKGNDVPLRTVAERLHVTTLLEGSVRRAGNRVRITVQLVNAADGYHLWSERYDRELTDIFAVQEEIAHAIAATLGRRLRDATGASASSEESKPATRHTRQRVSVEAYDEYLKGRFANRNLRGEGHEPGPGHFLRAIELEPEFAAAYAGLAESYLWLTFAGNMAPSDTFARVRRHARRALEIDPELADAHWLLAEAAVWHDWDVSASERHIRDALAHEEHHALAIMTSATCHMVRRRRNEGLTAVAEAIHIDPLGVGTLGWAIAHVFNVEAYDLAMEYAERLIRDRPDYGQTYRWRAMIHLIKGRLESARADLEKAKGLGGPDSWAERSEAVIASQQLRMDEVRAIRDDFVARWTRGWFSPVMIGQAEQALGDYDAAFAWYERAYQVRDHWLVVLPTDATFQLGPPGQTPITDDPRWATLIRRIGLAP